MTITKDEAYQIKSDIEVLKTSTKQCLQATTKSADASAKVAEQISNLLIEMKERDVREEYRTKEIVELKEAIGFVDKRIADFIDTELPTLTRSKLRHGRVDKVLEGLSSNVGKLIGIALVVGVMVMLGIDPTKLIK